MRPRRPTITAGAAAELLVVAALGEVRMADDRLDLSVTNLVETAH